MGSFYAPSHGILTEWNGIRYYSLAQLVIWLSSQNLIFSFYHATIVQYMFVLIVARYTNHTTEVPFIVIVLMLPLGNTAVCQLLGELTAVVVITSNSFKALSTVFPKPTGGKKSPSTVPGRINLSEGNLSRSLPKRVGWLGYWVRM